MVDREYCPLDVAFRHIRVLDLEPSNNVQATIHCRLRVVSLNEQTQCEALSYTWGAPEPKKTISLGGSGFEAQENLVAAFRRLRCASTTRTFWDDAILELKDRIANVYVYNSIDHERVLLHAISSVFRKGYQYGYGVYDNKNVEKVYKDFHARIVRPCAHRRILVSAKAYIGLAPWNARTRDTIAVLRGGCTPF